MVASRFIIDENEDFINETIIDGRENGSVVMMRDCENQPVLIGFTIRNGYLQSELGGGIYCNNTSPTIIENIITDNQVGIYPSYWQYELYGSLLEINNISSIISNKSSCNLKSYFIAKYKA